MQYAEPWVSETDISAGDRWALAIAGELESSNFGIICATPENISSEWVLFEAGALAKSMQDAKVIPLLFGLEFSDISGPLAQFQAKKVDQNGLHEIIQAINSVSENKTSDDIINNLVPALWPQLEKSLSDIPDPEPSEKHMRPQHEIIEELVTGVRGLEARMRDFDFDGMDFSSKRYRKKFRRLHPMMFEEFFDMSPEFEDDPIPLLMVGGMLRDDFPWLAEIVIELYRDIKNNPLDAERAIHKFRRTMKMMDRGPFMEEFVGGSKETHMMVMELPHMLEHFLHRYSKSWTKDNEED